MMVNAGDADAVVSGYSMSYPTVVKPMLELVGLQKEQLELRLQTL